MLQVPSEVFLVSVGRSSRKVRTTRVEDSFEVLRVGTVTLISLEKISGLKTEVTRLVSLALIVVSVDISSDLTLLLRLVSPKLVTASSLAIRVRGLTRT